MKDDTINSEAWGAYREALRRVLELLAEYLCLNLGHPDPPCEACRTALAELTEPLEEALISATASGYEARGIGLRPHRHAVHAVFVTTRVVEQIVTLLEGYVANRRAAEAALEELGGN